MSEQQEAPAVQGGYQGGQGVYQGGMKKYGQEQSGASQTLQRIRVTLYSQDVSAITRVGNSFIRSAKEKRLVVKGVRRMPRTTLRVTTRKSPGGQGTNTWDKYEMRIHKHYLDIYASPNLMSSISSFAIIDPKVDVEVTIL